MKTIEISVYSFDELSDAAKDVAREWYRQGALDYAWYDCVCELVKDAGARLGIEVDRVEFSGFSARGDGASFEGSYRYKKGWRKALSTEFGGHTLAELTTLGEALQRAQAPHFYSARVTIRPTARNFDLDMACDSDYSTNQDNLYQALRDFASWVYNALEAEHDYLLSGTVIDEGLTANGYIFTENGELWA